MIIPWFNSIKYDSLIISSPNIHSVPYGQITDSFIVKLVNSQKYISQDILLEIANVNWLVTTYLTWLKAEM